MLKAEAMSSLRVVDAVKLGSGRADVLCLFSTYKGNFHKVTFFSNDRRMGQISLERLSERSPRRSCIPWNRLITTSASPKKRVCMLDFDNNFVTFRTQYCVDDRVTRRRDPDF